MTSMHTGKVSGPRRASVSDTSDSARELLHHRSNPHPWNLHSQRKIWKKIMRHFSCGKRSCLSFANRVTITRRLNFASLIPQMGQELLLAAGREARVVVAMYIPRVTEYTKTGLLGAGGWVGEVAGRTSRHTPQPQKPGCLTWGRRRMKSEQPS